MAWNDSGINAYVRDLVTPMLHSSFVTTKPLLRVMAGRDTTGLDSLGDPEYGVLIGGRELGKAQKKRLNGSIVHKFRYQKNQTDVAESVLPGNNTPTATGFAEDNVGTAGTNWVHFWNPIKVREDSVNDIRNGGGSPESRNLQIAEVIEEAVGQGFQRSLEKHQDQLWNGTLTSTQQGNSPGWVSHIGVTQWVDDGSTAGMDYVGNVDRTVETELKGNLIPAADLTTDGILSNDEVHLDMFRHLKIIQTGVSSATTYGGIKNKNANAGDLAITTPTLWAHMAADAETKHRIVYSADMPSIGLDGFKFPVIMKDDTMVTYDPDCPAGHAYLFTTSSWVFEVQDGSNFAVEPWQRKWQNEEGGGYYRWTNIHAKTRFTCREPWLQCKVTGLDITA